MHQFESINYWNELFDVRTRGKKKLWKLLQCPEKKKVPLNWKQKDLEIEWVLSTRSGLNNNIKQVLLFFNLP